MATKVTEQKRGRGRPDEAARTVKELRKTPGRFQIVGTFKLTTTVRRIERLRTKGLTDFKVEGTPEATTLKARIKIGQKVS